MAKLLPLNQFFDANGLPLVSGTVTTCISGSNTPKATYTDASGGTPHANPVQLSAGGRAEIWLDTDTAYRLIIKDSHGVQIGNVIDNVLPTTMFASATITSNIDLTGYSLITSSGNDDIRLNPYGTGKVYISGAYKLPSTVPASGEVLRGNGSTTLEWGLPASPSLSTIADVTLTSPANGDLLKYNGSVWVNVAQSTFTFTASQITDLGSASIAFTNKSGNISQWTNDSGYAVLSAIPSASMAFTNKTGNISMWTNDAGYITTAPTSEASQSDMETATSSTTFVSPRRVQQHPGVAKAWCLFTNGNPETIVASYNIASLTRVSAGVIDVAFTTNMSSADYAIISRNKSESNNLTISTFTNKATSGFRITLTTAVDTAGTFSFACFGDQ